MNLKITTPLSTVFQKANASQKERILALSDVLEWRHGIDSGVRSNKQRIYHAEESIVEPWSDEEVAAIAQRIEREHITYVSFHVAACYVKPPVEQGTFVPKGEAMSEQEMRANVATNVARLRVSGVLIPIGIENNNYFPTGAYEIVTDPAFLTRLMVDTDLVHLLDIAHAEITAKHTGLTLDAYLAALPLERTIQFHISGITRREEGYLDTHGPLAEVDWQQLQEIRTRCPNLQYLTLEYYRDPAVLISMLERLHTYLI